MRARCKDGVVSSARAQTDVVIRISPMAYFGVGFFTLGLLALIFAWPGYAAVLLILPILLAAAVFRYRTVADRDHVRVRTLLGSRTVRWEEIDGLRFTRSSWARARLTDGSELVLPAVTFSTLPLLTAASGGRVPNPYE
ncbi:PH domain-containing protein [Mycolicibacterium sp. Y3]